VELARSAFPKIETKLGSSGQTRAYFIIEQDMPDGSTRKIKVDAAKGSSKSQEGTSSIKKKAPEPGQS